MNLEQEIKHKALELGFDLVAITDASEIDAKQIKMLYDWIKSGYAGQMEYMHRNFEKRSNPSKLLKDAQSIIVVGLNYKPPKRCSSLRASLMDAWQSHHAKLEIAAMTEPIALVGKVANYALYEDYHIFIKKQLHKLVDYIVSLTSQGPKYKICVDSAPVAERALAARAGLGFIGKNHMLINPTLGLQILLGEIITTLKLRPDGPITSDCSNCNVCIDACPTGALRADGQLDATKCISYLTIEYKGKIPKESAEKIGNRLFGCDECVLACPYQRNAPVRKNKQFKFYNDKAVLDLNHILNMTQEKFKAEFTDSPIKRLSLDLLKRNASICLANINNPRHFP